MQRFSKRFLSLVLSASLLAGVIGVLPTPFGATVKAEATSENVLSELNFSFEAGTASNGLPKNWVNYNNSQKYCEVLDATDSKLPEGAPATASDGRYYLKFTMPESTEENPQTDVRGLRTQEINVSDMDALWVGMDTCGDSVVQLYIKFLTADKKAINVPAHIDIQPTANWTQSYIEVNVPEDAVWAYCLIYKSYRGTHVGTSYIDRVIFTETTALPDSTGFPEVPEEVNYNWQIIETEHPRVYFNKTELAEIKKFANSSVVTSMGYSGKEIYDKLIKEADKYLEETSFSYTWAGTTISFPVYPVLEDMSIRPEFELAPAPSYAIPYPYMTQATWRIQDRVEALSLAYLLTAK